MAGKLPWFSWFPEDWLTSDFFLATDIASHGLFIDVLSKMWTSASCGIGARVVRAMASRLSPLGVSRECQQEIANAVLDELIEHPTCPGVLTHPKLHVLWLEAGGKQSQRSVAGKKGAAARWSNRPRNAGTGPTDGDRHGDRMRPPMQDPDPDPDPEPDKEKSTHPNPPKGGPTSVVDSCIRVLASLDPCQNAEELHDLAERSLKEAGLQVDREFQVRDRGDGRRGRVDLAVNGRVGIEIDRGVPRQKSILKLDAFEAGIVVCRSMKIGVQRQLVGPTIIGLGGHEKKKPPKMTAEELLQAYCDTLPELPVPRLPLAKGVRKIIEDGIRRQDDDLTAWIAYFEEVRKFDWPMGRSGDFQATLMWLVGPKNRDKIEGGFYDRSKKSGGGGSLSGMNYKERPDDE